EVFDFFQLVAAWPQIVGPRVALQTLPLKNTGTALTILVGHPTYAQQLSFMEDNLRQKIITLFPNLRSKIKRFFFQTNPRFFREEKQRQARILAQAKAEVAAPMAAVARPWILHPQSPEYQRLYTEASQQLANVEDEELKQQLISIYIQAHAP
ncbi:MAG: DUF721 domain-containing protein, partial [Bacteriovoracaceae bacterium]|nr:DUF721 domain-containing protein [Bacteriovoracaceae bacterium]